MYNGNSNLAYDLSLFEVDEEYEKKKEQKREEKSHIRMTEKKAVARNGSIFATVVSAVLCIAVAFSILYSKVELAEYTAMISEVKTQLETEQRENDRLNAELDSMVTLDNVESIAATELGLQKTQNSQINFVTLNTEKMTEVAQTDTNIFVSIKDWFYDVLEYLGF
ncbi:MAG: hypothetical protein IJ035_02670 [Oscillospiraceae bacterium]|nr:hypothetical protein [Oscillospiraceae bacterium]